MDVSFRPDRAWPGLRRSVHVLVIDDCRNSSDLSTLRAHYCFAPLHTFLTDSMACFYLPEDRLVDTLVFDGAWNIHLSGVLHRFEIDKDRSLSDSSFPSVGSLSVCLVRLCHAALRADRSRNDRFMDRSGIQLSITIAHHLEILTVAVGYPIADPLGISLSPFSAWIFFQVWLFDVIRLQVFRDSRSRSFYLCDRESPASVGDFDIIGNEYQ